MTINSSDLGCATGLRRTGARPVKVTTSMLGVAAGGAKSCPIRSGDEVRCTQGKVWVTFEGDSRDYVLARGESAFAPARGRAVIQAIAADGEVRIVSFAS